MTGARTATFLYRPAERYPGWHEWVPILSDTFVALVIGDLLVRTEAPGIARCRMFPTRLHSNQTGGVHGGMVAAFVDVVMFAGAHQLGISTDIAGVTVDMQVQMVAPGRIDEPLDALVEVVREGHRLAFIRGLLVQGENDERIAAFSSTFKKAGRQA